MANQSVKKDLFVWVLIIALLSACGIYLYGRDAANKFGTLAYGSVPYFSFIDQNGYSRTLHMMKGRVWLINFLLEPQTNFSTSNLLTLKEIGNKYKKSKFNVAIVSAQKIEDIVKKSALQIDDDELWVFLHGTETEVLNFMQPAFFNSIDKQLGMLSLYTFLIDQNGTIRGIYNLSSLKETTILKDHIGRLL